MANKDDLVKAIDSLLSSVGGSGVNSYLNRDKEDSAYEAYIFTLVLKAIEKLAGKAAITLRGIKNDPSSSEPFVFRGSPGKIDSNRKNYGYAYCIHNGKEFEVHVDVQYCGTSGVQHEVDVSILDHKEAEYCRNSNASPKPLPRTRNLRFAFEGKFYGSNLDTELIRTFTGLVDDLGTLRHAGFVSNLKSTSIEQYCRRKLTRPDFYQSVTPLHRKEEQEFIDKIHDELKKWL